MLDDSLPIYRFQPSSENPLNTLLYFTHNGSEPSLEYLLKRPSPETSKNQYALGLLDPHYGSVIYAEVLVKPEWSQPSLSAAELRAQNGVATVVPYTPDSFNVLLYNPDQSIPVICYQSKWTKSDSWEFEIPERSFRLPSTSQLDQESGATALSELTPKVLFRWKRDSRLSKDMTCYMTGRSVGGKKSKEPDITVAMFQSGKNSSAVSIYEPNMRRVEVEDRKGLETMFLLSAEVIKDLYLSPKQDVFNSSGAPVPVATPEGRNHTPPSGPSSRPGPPPSRPGPSSSGAVYASGALGNVPPPPPQSKPPPPRRDAQQQAQIDAETRRLQAMVAEEERSARDRDKRDQEEQKRIRRMLEQEDKERQRRQAEIDKETERLRKEYGVSGAGATPSLPPRPGQGSSSGGSGQAAWFGGPSGQAVQSPPRPSSTGPSPPGQSGRHRLGNALGALMHGGREENKVQKKRSVHF